MESAPPGLGDPGGLGELLGHDLVHRHCAAEHSAAHVGDVGDLEQPLDGAVLAHRAMEEGEHDAGGIEHGERIDDLSLDLDGCSELIGIDRTSDPSAIAGDPHRGDGVALGVGRGEDVASGDSRDVMLGRATTEQQHEGESGIAGHRRNGSRRAPRHRRGPGRHRYGCAMEWTTAELAHIVGGTLHGPDVLVAGVAFDSRTLRPGQLFVPVTGVRDGHEFIDAAVSAGAAATLSARGPIDGTPTIVVASPETALSTLGGAARDRLASRVAGVTGSVGKTSTKDLAATVVGRRFVTWANEKSFNNELGVPLTLVNAPDDTEATIVEMGSRGRGHITELCRIARPDVAIVTAIELAHSEFMGGLDDIAAAKGELVESLDSSGTAILNVDNDRVAAMAGRTAATSVMFGRDRGEVRATNVRVDDELRVHFELRSDWGSAPVTLGVRGDHHVTNALAAATLAFVWGVPIDDVIDGLAAARLSPWRMELHVAPSGTHVLNDAYNAGPASMEAALRSLEHLPAERQVAVLGPMAELGVDSIAAHQRISGIARDLGITVIAFGTDAYGVEPVMSIHDAVEALESLGPIDGSLAVLVKGSRVAGLERLAERLLSS